jgi:hypothetical protein
MTTTTSLRQVQQAAYAAYSAELEVSASCEAVRKAWNRLGHATRQLVAAALASGDVASMKGVDLDPVLYGGSRTKFEGGSYRFETDTNGCSQVVKVSQYGKPLATLVVRLGYWTGSAHQLVCVDKMV